MKNLHCAGENWLFSGSMTLGLHFYFCFYFLRFHQNGSRDLLGFHCSKIAIFPDDCPKYIVGYACFIGGLSNCFFFCCVKQMDVLICEINHASCYEMIKKFCEVVLNQLPSLRKLRYQKNSTCCGNTQR